MSDYRWSITVRELNTYGDRVIKETPMTIIATTRSEVTTKMRAAFGATYDDFRKFWSRGWILQSVDEIKIQPPTDEHTTPIEHDERTGR